jgi:hypothetical protein
MLGLILGAVLGAIDGLTALFSGGPEVKAAIMMIVVFSTIKSMIAGVLIGLLARKFQKLGLMMTVGLVIGFILAFIIAAMPSESGEHYWVEIIVPGSLVGLILGFVTQRYGRTPAGATA